MKIWNSVFSQNSSVNCAVFAKIGDKAMNGQTNGLQILYQNERRMQSSLDGRFSNAKSRELTQRMKNSGFLAGGGVVHFVGLKGHESYVFLAKAMRS